MVQIEKTPEPEHEVPKRIDLHPIDLIREELKDDAQLAYHTVNNRKS